ncbi:hypothetical protein GQF61_04940 [Sphingobacterium sp. DK4209]|uniref:Putative auto-transporter adhesin head GIN domain-containing protein n=1 Tax=Sphingobacterium zhuxiongii TaxID=2662364 RepID=A0A5Q0Q9N2_9SPHI|nr:MULTISPECIES: head GIN domain-containing protein [unclassified Sphingobacterium]MVZ65189.1 hypothetical protein [Sphingobacterium sp. DK4209]QGA26136.1 hypothetical protein GFH32_07270 [Sphingobacterium sp. dk4302]
MRKLLTIAFIGFASLSYAQQSEVRKISSKPIGISVSTGIQAKIIKSNKNEVVLEAQNQNQLGKIETKVESGVLTIRVKRNSNIQNSKNLKATVYINPNLSSIELSSAGSLEITDAIDVRDLDIDLSSAGSLKTAAINANALSIETSSASKVHTGAIKATTLAIEASSASVVEISGASKTTSIEASSNANINAQKLSSNKVTADASSGAKINIHVTESLSAEASSGARVSYTGQPKATSFEKSSGGTISNAN